jgi:hypothetical protein
MRSSYSLDADFCGLFETTAAADVPAAGANFELQDGAVMLNPIVPQCLICISWYAESWLTL